MHSVTVSTPPGGVPEGALPPKIAVYERLEADATQKPLAGDPASLNSHMAGGYGYGLWLYSDILAPADECTFDKFRDAALRDELRGRRGLLCAPGSTPEAHFAPYALTEVEHLGVVTSIQAAPSPGLPPAGLQTPIRSVAAARRTGQREGPGG